MKSGAQTAASLPLYFFTALPLTTPMLRIVYFGTANFAVPPLKALLSARNAATVVAVVTQPDKPAGRSGEVTASPVARVAREAGVTLLQPAKIKVDAVRDELAALNADLFVVAAYGKIIPMDILALPRLGCINLHGSLLPKYRGASPIQAAIAAGEPGTGVALMFMDEQVDHGPVLATVAVPIDPQDTYASLEAKMADAAAELLVSHLDDLAAGNLEPREQDHDAATFTSIIGREDGFVRWADVDAPAVERLRRAFDPWPGIYATWTRSGKPMRIKLLDVCASEGRPGAAPGTVWTNDAGEPVVAAKDGGVRLLMVQPEGKKPMTGVAFLNGYREFSGATLDVTPPRQNA